MPPKLNRRRAQFVLTKIDEILAWEQQKEVERDTKFVELGDISVKSGRGSTGGWKTSNRLTTSWRDDFPNRDGKPIT
jgi:hypothetical protein